MGEDVKQFMIEEDEEQSSSEDDRSSSDSDSEDEWHHFVWLFIFPKYKILPILDL